MVRILAERRHFPDSALDTLHRRKAISGLLATDPAASDLSENINSLLRTGQPEMTGSCCQLASR
jgi:hypothetical protein